jgi:hypothetical protein
LKGDYVARNYKENIYAKISAGEEGREKVTNHYSNN